MTATEAAEALVAWASATCEDLNSAYDYDPQRISAALPVATAAVESEAVVRSDPTLGIEVADLGIEQAGVHTMRSTLALLVDPSDDEAAARQLEGFVADLAAALKADTTLGERVTACAPYWSASYEPPFLEFDDGTKARVAYLTVTLAELA